MKKILFAIAALLVAGASFAQAVTKVSSLAWLGLTSVEQARIQDANMLEIIDGGRFGQIVDNQSVDESTPGTNSGATLGGAIADASYIDKSIKNGTYSAKGQLGATLLGAVLGSALDSPAQARFHVRYTVKLGNGEILTSDQIQQDPFRKPIGLCVFVPELLPIDQKVCAQTSDLLRSQFNVMTLRESRLPNPSLGLRTSEAARAPSMADIVQCKVNNLAPVGTSEEKCRLIGGVKIP